MNNLTAVMKPGVKALVILVIVVHLMFFILEALFWMQPVVYTVLLDFLANPVTVSYPAQALTLKSLFINQGFYNLFIAIAGLTGLRMISRGNLIEGYVLILFLCFCGFGAGLVLACSTKAYMLAFLQSAPAAFGFLYVYKLYRRVKFNVISK
jgi:putative membrane protein